MDLEGDMAEPDLPALRPLSLGRGIMPSDVERVEIFAQRHEDAAMLGVFLGDEKAEHVAVEALGNRFVANP